ncbi:MAG TPA: hypothetical protein VMQ76_13240 [Terracidiphilus sp.]|nr:hypothetical protein [Terracidiphilus sp.]
MKKLILIPILLLCSCASFRTAVTKLQADLAAIVASPNSATLITAAENAVKVIVANTRGKGVTDAYNDISALATVYQAYVGTGTAPANVIQSTTSISAIGTAASKVLSQFPATQTVATDLFAVASKLAPAGS